MGPAKTHIDGLPILEYLTTKWETKTSEYVRMPIYQLDAYLDLRERYDRQLGIEFDRAAYVQSLAPLAVPEKKKPERQPHTPVSMFDKVYVRIRYTETGVCVKLLSKMFTIYEKYYTRGKQPPIDELVDAYKEHGYGEKFLLNVIKADTYNRDQRSNLFGRTIARLFPEPKKAKKKSTKAAKVVVEDSDSEIMSDAASTDDDDTDADDEGAFDMEYGEEDEPETNENEEEGEEEFIDDAVL